MQNQEERDLDEFQVDGETQLNVVMAKLQISTHEAIRWQAVAIAERKINVQLQQEIARLKENTDD